MHAGVWLKTSASGVRISWTCISNLWRSIIRLRPRLRSRWVSLAEQI